MFSGTFHSVKAETAFLSQAPVGLFCDKNPQRLAVYTASDCAEHEKCIIFILFILLCSFSAMLICFVTPYTISAQYLTLPDLVRDNLWWKVKRF